MTGFKIVPQISIYRDFSEFAQTSALCADDLIVTDRFLYDNYLAHRNLPCRCICQDDYGPGEPSSEKVTKVLQAAYSAPYKRVIAIGGGTAIDIAKLVRLAQIPDLLALYQGKTEPKREKELIIIPTTCGTGSEVTNISIVAFEQLNTKLGLAKDALYADTAALVPEFLENLPYKVFIFSSMDALIHAVESYLSPKANAITRFFSEKAIRMIISGYMAVSDRGESARRELTGDFLLASTYAGIAFSNAGCGLIHAMSYPLSGEYHIAHGEANHQLFLAVMDYYKDNRSDDSLDKLYLLFADIFKCGPADADEKFQTLVRSMIERKPLSSYGADEDMLKSFARQVIQTQQRLLANAYIDTDEDAMLRIYRSLL